MLNAVNVSPVAVLHRPPHFPHTMYKDTPTHLHAVVRMHRVGSHGPRVASIDSTMATGLQFF